MKAPSMRSFCSRSIITTSASRSPSAMSSKTSTPQSAMRRRHQRRRPDQAQAVLHLAQQVDVRPRHAGMGDVAADRDGQAVQPPLFAPDRQRVEQRLGGVLVPPVAGVQDRAVHLLRQQVHGARMGWRTTSRSGCIAFSVIAVSISVSPFLMDDACIDMFITSAPSRLPAISKLACVRVEASKNMLIWVSPSSGLGRFPGAAFGIGVAVGEVEDGPDFVRVQGLDPQKMRLPEGHGPLSSPLPCL
jgi:hypothetical protein